MDNLNLIHGENDDGEEKLEERCLTDDDVVNPSTSWENLLQTLSLFLCSLYFIMPMIVVCWYWTAILFLFPLTTLQVSMYLGYILKVDASPESGRCSTWIRSFKFWKYGCDRFPLLLVKTAELDPDQSYVIGYHPHGIISCGAIGAFASDGAKGIVLCTGEVVRGFSSLFPGIDQRLVTFPIFFKTPFLREYLLGLGCCNNNKQTCRNILNRNGGRGNALVIAVGSTNESRLVNPMSTKMNVPIRPSTRVCSRGHHI